MINIELKVKLGKGKYLHTISHSSLTHPVYDCVIQIPENCKAVMYFVSTFHGAIEFDVTSPLYHDKTTVTVMNLGMNFCKVQCEFTFATLYKRINN